MQSRRLALVLIAVLSLGTGTAHADALIGPPPPPPQSHVGEHLIISGAVIAAIGVTVAVGGMWAGFVDAIKHIGSDPDSPPRVVPQGPHDAIVGGGITILVGGATAIIGVIVRAKRPKVHVATQPLGFRF